MTKRRTDRQLADDIVAKLNSEEDNAAHPAMEINSLLQQARDAGGGALRMQYLETAQREIAKLDPSRHGRLIAQLQGELLALQGRRGDTKVAHVTPGEVVIPARLQTPELLAALRAAAKQAGIDPARLIVGSRHNSINPNTGQAEFVDQSLAANAFGITNLLNPHNGEILSPPPSSPEIHMTSDTIPPGNDNFPKGSFPRQEACWDAGYECLDSDNLNPQERNMCNVARQLCDQAADAHRNAPPDARFVERFPHGRTVIIPGGGARPYLGPFVPSRRPK